MEAMTTDIPDDLLDLAPTDLTIRRNTRYDGGGFGVRLRRFAPEDISSMYQVYEVIKGIYGIWLYAGQSEQDPLDYRLYKPFFERLGAPEFVLSLQGIGTATFRSDDQRSLDLRRIIHDIRGGGMSGLVGYAGLLELEPENRDYLQSAVFLARDHAKMMRNALVDLDVAVRNADELEKVHGIDGFVIKWDGTTIRLGERESRVEVRSWFDGDISSRCLETSAIDRVLYNLLNNAARFTADDVVTLSILPVPGGLVRWVVDNRIAGSHRQWLADNVGDDLSRLFEGGFTAGGSGIGLSNCASFVSRAVGVTDSPTAVHDGYIGASLQDDLFRTWFHWPAHIPAAGEERCTCRD